MNCVLLALPKNFTKFKLSPVETMVYGYYHSFALNDRDGFSKQGRLAADLGYRADTIKKARLKLKEKGLLLRSQITDNGYKTIVWLPCLDLDLLIEILKGKGLDADKINEILEHVKNKQNSYINQIDGEKSTTMKILGINDPQDQPNDPHDHGTHTPVGVISEPCRGNDAPLLYNIINIININELYLYILNNNLIKDLLDLKDQSKPLSIEQIDFNFFDLFEDLDLISFSEGVEKIAEGLNLNNFKTQDYNYYAQMPFTRAFRFHSEASEYFEQVKDQQNIAFPIHGTKLPHPLIFIGYVLPTAYSCAGIEAVQTLIAGFKDAYGVEFNDCVTECLNALKGQ